MKIWRTLKDMKKLVSDVMLANTNADEEKVQVCIDLKDNELMSVRKDVAGELIIGFAKEVAKEDERTRDFTDDDWDNFEERVRTDILYTLDFTSNCVADEDDFYEKFKENVKDIIKDMQASFYEVEVELEFRIMRVTIPVKARSKDQAEEWVENMPYSDIYNYMDDVEIEGVEVDDIDEVDDYDRDYEDAT